MNKTIQAKDISTERFLVAIAENENVRGHPGAILWEMADILEIPRKVVQAKAKALIKQGIITGCACGCRGSFEVVERD